MVIKNGGEIDLLNWLSALMLRGAIEYLSTCINNEDWLDGRYRDVDDMMWFVNAPLRSAQTTRPVIEARVVKFGSKGGQIGTKRDKSGSFSDHISVHLVPAWPTLEANLTTLIEAHGQMRPQKRPDWHKLGKILDFLMVLIRDILDQFVSLKWTDHW